MGQLKVAMASEGQAVRVVPCLIVIACLALLPGGCAIFGKRSGEGDRAPKSDGPGKPPAKFPGSGGDSRPTSSKTNNKDPLFESSANGGDSGVILAGKVMDSFNHVPGNVFVRWTCVDNGKESTPADVAVSADGYFTIAGLKRGGQYKLIGRAKQGERVLAGMSYTTAPNIRVVIRLSEDLANVTVPDVPGPPAYQAPKKETPEQPKEEPKKSAMSGPERPNGGWAPAPPSISIGMPRPETDPPTPPPPMKTQPASTNGGWLPGIADDGRNWPPTVDIPGPGKGQPTLPMQIRQPTPLTENPDPPPPPPPPVQSAPLPPSPPASASPLESTPPLGAARVPSCILLGKRLFNLALNDIHGQPWEYRSQVRGKLVLLDFWGTHCKPCIASLPALRKLHETHHQAGLEVIGIVCHADSDRSEVAQRVQTLCQRHNIAYRQLLSGGERCPVRTDFGVQAIPTLVLLDENGGIIWRHRGQLDASSFEEVDLMIKRRLGMK